MSSTSVPVSVSGDSAVSVSRRDFSFISVLGKGAYGKVYLVSYKPTGELFAMKVMRKKDLSDSGSYARQERLVLQAIDHPFIVHLHFAFQTSSKLFLVLNYASGGELTAVLDAAEERTLTISHARFVAAEIVLALEYLHQRNIVYRDLKPENVMINGDGHVVLTDFGLAKPNVKRDNQTYTVCGTVYYMSPEALDPSIGYSASSDYWSLGVLLYEMLCGRVPFDDVNEIALRKKIRRGRINVPWSLMNKAPPAVELIKGLLNVDPEQRWGKDVEKLKHCEFFKDINWSKLSRKRVSVPFVPVSARRSEGVGASLSDKYWSAIQSNENVQTIRRTISGNAKADLAPAAAATAAFNVESSSSSSTSSKYLNFTFCRLGDTLNSTSNSSSSSSSSSGSSSSITSLVSLSDDDSNDEDDATVNIDIAHPDQIPTATTPSSSSSSSSESTTQLSKAAKRRQRQKKIAAAKQL